MSEVSVCKLEGLIRDIIWERIKAALPPASAWPKTRFDTHWMKAGILGINASNFINTGSVFTWECELDGETSKALRSKSKVACTISGRMTYPVSYSSKSARSILSELMYWKWILYCGQRRDPVLRALLTATLEQNFRSVLLNETEAVLAAAINCLQGLYVVAVLAGRSP